MTTNGRDSEITKRLDILIHLILRQQKEIPVTKKNMKDVVAIFYQCGMDDYKSIAGIISAKNPVSVANILTKLKGTEGTRKHRREN